MAKVSFGRFASGSVPVALFAGPPAFGCTGCAPNPAGVRAGFGYEDWEIPTPGQYTGEEPVPVSGGSSVNWEPLVGQGAKDTLALLQMWLNKDKPAPQVPTGGYQWFGAQGSQTPKWLLPVGIVAGVAVLGAAAWILTAPKKTRRT